MYVHTPGPGVPLPLPYPPVRVQLPVGHDHVRSTMERHIQRLPQLPKCAKDFSRQRRHTHPRGRRSIFLGTELHDWKWNIEKTNPRTSRNSLPNPCSCRRRTPKIFDERGPLIVPWGWLKLQLGDGEAIDQSIDQTEIPSAGFMISFKLVQSAHGNCGKPLLLNVIKIISYPEWADKTTHICRCLRQFFSLFRDGHSTCFVRINIEGFR